MEQLKICVLGSANQDIFLSVDEWPKSGITINATSQTKAFGGKGANQALAGSKLGYDVLFAGQVGQDQTGDDISEWIDMEKFGVDVSNIQKTDKASTGKAIIILHQDGDNEIILVSGANHHYNVELPLPNNYCDAIQEGQLLLLQLEIPMEINVKAAEYANDLGSYLIIENLFQLEVMVALDCGGDDLVIKDDLLRNLDFISPNETELQRLIPDYDPLKDGVGRLRKYLKKYPNLNVVLKLGSKGSMFVNQQHKIYMPAITAFNSQIEEDFKIIDTTGAGKIASFLTNILGDCFTAAFFAKLMELMQFERNFSQILQEEQVEYVQKSLLFANACAFLAITVKGAMPSMPRLKTVKDFFDNYTTLC